MANPRFQSSNYGGLPEHGGSSFRELRFRQTRSVPVLFKRRSRTFSRRYKPLSADERRERVRKRNASRIYLPELTRFLSSRGRYLGCSELI